jgi:hypothetical protein
MAGFTALAGALYCATGQGLFLGLGGVCAVFLALATRARVAGEG